MTSLAGIFCLSSLYVAGLLCCILAGVTSPDIFIEKSSLATNTTSKASTTYAFDVTDYQRSHQSLYLARRPNIPAHLNTSIVEESDGTLLSSESFRITVYGSPQATVSNGSCPTGCNSCSEGNAELGLACFLVADKLRRKGDITCEAGDEWCSWVDVYSIDFISFKTYYWQIEVDSGLDDFLEDDESSRVWMSQFRVVFVSQWWTRFELAWFYFWTTTTLLVMFLPGIGFFSVAARNGLRWGDWTRQQRWLCVLLVALFFFNHPFFAAEIYSDGAVIFYVLYAFAGGALVCLTFMFWMDTLFEIGRNQDGRARGNETLARTAMYLLTSLIFVCYIVTMIELRMAKDGNPNQAHTYPSTFSTGEQLLAIICFVYCGWMLALTCRAWWADEGGQTLKGSPRRQLLFWMSCVAILLLVPSVMLQHLSPRMKGGLSFCLAHGSINVYYFVMALCCAPRQRNVVDAAIGEGETYSNDAVEPRLSGNREKIDVATASMWWWRPGKGRPKISDSSVWEDVTGDAI